MATLLASIDPSLAIGSIVAIVAVASFIFGSMKASSDQHKDIYDTMKASYTAIPVCKVIHKSVDDRLEAIQKGVDKIVEKMENA